jgi:hypothetical protein
MDAHTEPLPRNDQARAETPLGTADLVRQANTPLTDRDGTAGQGSERTPLFQRAIGAAFVSSGRRPRHTSSMTRARRCAKPTNSSPP